MTGWHLWCVLGNASLPGQNPIEPLGWWTWWDQGKVLDSARALASGNMHPARHWYPLGYAVLGAPFTAWSHIHPFLPVNLGSLLLAFAGFLAVARRTGVPRGWAVILFLLSTAGSRMLFEGWIVPWNTIPAAALIWLLLAAVAAHLEGGRQSFWIGLLAAAIPLVRPTELLLAAPCALAALAVSLRRQVPESGRWRDPALMTAGGLLVLAPYAALHLRIYGFAPSPYMAQSHDLGFTLHGLGWKAYTLLEDPRAWFGDGRGLLWRAPWAALALPGLAVAWAHGRAAGLLAVLAVLHMLLYLSYVDLLPTGLWRYQNFHYFQWVMPGLALLAFLAARDVRRWRAAPMFPLAPLALAVSVIVLCLRLEPMEVSAGTPARMLAYAGPPPEFEEAYFASLAVRDDAGELRGLGALRAIPVPGGMRVYAVRRDFGPGVTWVTPPAGWQDGAAPVRYGVGWRWGVPCWLRVVDCTRKGQSLMPDELKY